MFFRARNLQNRQKVVPLYCVFHSIRFKFNKGWSKALLIFLCLYANYWTYRYRELHYFSVNLQKHLLKRYIRITF